MTFFSIIIPTFNRANLIEKTIQSVLHQNFLDYEIIVVDDGSTDDTSKVLLQYESKIKIFYQTNQGSGAARNLGIQNAKGKYVAFLDSDDLWLPWTLEVFSKLIHKHNYPAILSAKLVEFDNDKALIALEKTPINIDVFNDYYASHDKGYFVGSGMAVLRRDELLKAGNFTECRINGEDHDLILRMGTAPGFIQVLAPATLGWRKHTNNSTNNICRLYEGADYLVQQEHSGTYPGGKERIYERHQILTRHIRPVTFACLKHGFKDEAWRLYWLTWRWHITLNKWKYLVGFPIRAIFS